MRIYTTLLATSGDPEQQGRILKVDTIQYEGRMWLVPMWLDKQGEGWSIPERLVCLDTPPHQKIVGPTGDFLLNDPIPKAVLDGHVPSEAEFEYVVIERPDLRVPRSH